MKMYTIKFYSNSGYLLGESTSGFEGFSDVEQHAENLMKGDTSVKIASSNNDGSIEILEFLRVADIAKVVIYEQN